jgi:hypothetical protein
VLTPTATRSVLSSRFWPQAVLARLPRREALASTLSEASVMAPSVLPALQPSPAERERGVLHLHRALRSPLFG